MARPKGKKLTRTELAAMLADALNLLSRLRAATYDGCLGGGRNEDVFQCLALQLPENLRDEFLNKKLLRGSDLA